MNEALCGERIRTRIKFCGLTRDEDARLACRLGVDAVGVVFAERSRRCVTLEQALRLRDALTPFVALVALFMDTPAGQIEQIVARLQPEVLQFHGHEEDAFCRSFGLPYFKGLGLAGTVVDGAALRRRWPHAAGFVLDGHAPGQPGGSGQRLDIAAIPADPGVPWLLAGGLDADNVGAAILHARPWGVDVSSGIESAPGIKDPGKMRRFVEAVHAADARWRAHAGLGMR